MARFEIYFLGLICFITKDSQTVLADVVDDGLHLPFIFYPPMEFQVLTDSLTLSLPFGEVRRRNRMLEFLPSLKEHTFSNQVSNEVNLIADERRPINSRLRLPAGKLTIADCYDYEGVFQRKGTTSAPQPVARLTALIADDYSTDVIVRIGGSEITSLKPDSFLIVGNLELFAASGGGNHFTHHALMTDADGMDELVPESAWVAGKINKGTKRRVRQTSARSDSSIPEPPLDDLRHYDTVAKLLDPETNPKKGPIKIFTTTQIDCSSSQWP